MAIAMPDAVLVAFKERAQGLKEAVQLLKSKNIVEEQNLIPKTIGRRGSSRAWCLKSVFR